MGHCHCCSLELVSAQRRENSRKGSWLKAKKKAGIETRGFGLGNFAEFDASEPVTAVQVAERSRHWLEHFCWELLTLERTVCQISWWMWWFGSSSPKVQATDDALTVELTQTQLCITSSKQDTSGAWNSTWHTRIHHTLCKAAKVKTPL